MTPEHIVTKLAVNAMIGIPLGVLLAFVVVLGLGGCGPGKREAALIKQETAFMSSCRQQKAEFECIYLWKVANSNIRCSNSSSDMAAGVAAGLVIGGSK